MITLCVYYYIQTQVFDLLFCLLFYLYVFVYECSHAALFLSNKNVFKHVSNMPFKWDSPDAGWTLHQQQQNLVCKRRTDKVLRYSNFLCGHEYN